MSDNRTYRVTYRCADGWVSYYTAAPWLSAHIAPPTDAIDPTIALRDAADIRDAQHEHETER